MDNFIMFWKSLGGNAYLLAVFLFVFVFHIVNLIYKSIVICRKDNYPDRKTTEGVSVIITANNRAEELQQNLPYFLNQDYPTFEVIVVDECSEDHTQDVLAGMQVKYPRLKTTRIFPDTKFRNTKKLAINIGILAASNDILLFSETDCRPLSNQWIRKMRNAFDEKAGVVLAYANYAESERKVSFPRFFRFLRYLKMILLVKKGCYVLGDGRNMGYRKKLYLAEKGFSKNSQSYIGYDNEMVQALSARGKVRVVKEEQAAIEIKDPVAKTWKEDCLYYYVNKRRWNSTALLKANTDTFVIFIFYILGIFLIFNSIIQYYIILCIILVFLIDFITINLYLRHRRQRKLFLTSLIVSSIGFLCRWYYHVYSIFMSKKWR